MDIVRSIARAGPDYAAIKRLLAATQWEIDADEADLGFLRIFIPDPEDKFYRLIIGYRDPDHPPYSLLSFYVFPDSEEHLGALNRAFQSAAETIAAYLGPPTVTGQRRPSFRTWPYSYWRWSLPEGEFTLVQEEFDIQEGIDVTLWIQPVGTPLGQTIP